MNFGRPTFCGQGKGSVWARGPLPQNFHQGRLFGAGARGCVLPDEPPPRSTILAEDKRRLTASSSTSFPTSWTRTSPPQAGQRSTCPTRTRTGALQCGQGTVELVIPPGLRSRRPTFRRLSAPEGRTVPRAVRSALQALAAHPLAAPPLRFCNLRFSCRDALDIVGDELGNDGIEVDPAPQLARAGHQIRRDARPRE
jgi:hypothetical protein